MKRLIRIALVCFLALYIAGCAGTPRYSSSLEGERGAGRFQSTGMASFYAREFQGKKTASGERFNASDLTAAHRTLPFGTRVRVTNAANGLSVVVRINDRGPFKKSRIIDLSYAAAKRIGMVASGTARVRIEKVN